MLRRQWTQADFAREVGVSTGRLSEWISGKHQPSTKSLQRIADGRPRSHAKPETHWLEGHVSCGCGAPCYFVVRTGRADRLWTCRDQTLWRNGVRAEPCPMPISSAGNGWVERGVLTLLGEMLARAGTATDEQLRRHLGKPDSRLASAEHNLRELRRQQTRLLDLGIHGAPAGVIGPELAAVAARIAAAQQTVARLGPTRSLPDLRLARQFAADIAGTVAASPPGELREIAERLSLRVVVDPREWRVTLGFGPEYNWLGTPSRAGKRGEG